MKELEKILEEMQVVKEIMLSPQNIDCFGEPCKENDCLACVVNKCMEIVKKHINDDWIPVERELPPEPEENPEFEGRKLELYLVSIKGTKYPIRAIWNGKYFTDGFDKCDVIAWQPLPESYHPERSDNHDGE